MEKLTPAIEKLVENSKTEIERQVRILGLLRFQFLQKEQEILNQIEIETSQIQQYLKLSKQNISE